MDGTQILNVPFHCRTTPTIKRSRSQVNPIMTRPHVLARHNQESLQDQLNPQIALKPTLPNKSGYSIRQESQNPTRISETPNTNPGTRAEPQQIVAQRLLSCLQYPVPIKSSTKDLTRPTFCIIIANCIDQSYRNSSTGRGVYRRCQHGF